MDLNKVMLIGNLTRDPEGRTTPSGQTVTSFGIATNLVWKDANGERQRRPEFHNVVAWRKLAEICNQYLKKGNKIYIEGRLQTREWQGQDGVKRQRTEIIADNMIMLDTKNSSSSQSSKPFSAPAKESEEAPEESPKEPQVTDEIRVEDIPF